MSMIVSSYMVQSSAVNVCIEKKTGYSMSEGVSACAYIAMGLQEGNRADGWWNKYNTDTYYSNDCDFDKQEKEAKEYIADRLEHFAKDTDYAVRFMGRKLASQWNSLLAKKAPISD